MKKILILLFLISITLVFAVDIWEDDFETLTGWILNGEFEIDAPQGLGGEYGNPDPTSAFAGSNVLGVDLTGLGASLGDYETDLGIHEYFAISPAIDCSEFVEIELSFMKWLNVEQPQYDHAYISVSNDDGTTWIEIWTNTSQITEDSWSSINFDISEIANLSSNVRIRFSIGATDGSWQFSGWNIDNVMITGSSVAYGSIDGNVVDASNSEPIAFAQIMSQYGNTMSDEEGHFIINNIPVGSREIMVNALILWVINSFMSERESYKKALLAATLIFIISLLRFVSYQGIYGSIASNFIGGWGSTILSFFVVWWLYKYDFLVININVDCLEYSSNPV